MFREFGLQLGMLLSELRFEPLPIPIVQVL